MAPRRAPASQARPRSALPPALLAAALLFAPAPVLPQGPGCSGELHHPSPAAGDQFGCSVAAHGDVVAVGANLDDEGGRRNVGSVTVFTPAGATPQVLVPPDARADDEFGFSIAIDGDTMAVGAPLGDGARGDSGAVYVFRREGGRWVERQKLTALDAARGARFGQTVALGDGFLVAGAPSDGGAGSLAGAVYVFAPAGQGALFDQGSQVKLRPADAAPFDNFGYAVAIAGGTLAAGAPFDDDGSDAAGAVYLFEREGGQWRQRRKLTVPPTAPNDQFGVALALGGGDLVVGARRADGGARDSGLVYAYERRGAEWVLRQPPLAPRDPAAGQLFGVAVGLDGDRLVIGARGDAQRGRDAGAAYLFERARNPDGTSGAWAQAAKLLASSTSAGDGFGQSVAVSGATVIPGAYLDDPEGIQDAGSAGDCAAVVVEPCEVDLRLTVAKDPLTPASIVPGEVLTEVWRVSNGGPATATGGVLTVAAPQGLAAANPLPASCSRNAGGVVCALDNLASGTGVAVRLAFDVPACYARPRPIVNTATVTAGGRECNEADNTATASTPVAAGAADLEIAKTQSSPGQVQPGGEVIYALTVTNRGPHRACEAVAHDLVPAGLELLNAARSSCVATPGRVDCPLPELATLAPGSPLAFDLRFRVADATPPCPGPAVNGARVESRTADPVPGNNTAEARTALACDRDDFAVTGSDAPDPVLLGEPLEYTFTVRNLGTRLVPRAVVTIAVDPALERARWCRGMGCTPLQAPDGVTIADLLTLAPGAEEVYRVVGIAPGASIGVLATTASVALPSGFTDVVPANNAVRVETPVVARPGLSGRCTGGPDVAAEGDVVTFTFILVNGGPGDLMDGAGDEFADRLPAGLTPTAATASSGAVAIAARTVTWNGAIPAGGTVTITVSATVAPGTAGTVLCNRAAFAGGAPPSGDPNPPGTLDPCCLHVVDLTEIPTLSGPGLALLALLLAALAVRRLGL